MPSASTDRITLTLPQDREFHRVAHLVVGGLAARLELTVETLEDLQIALASVLDHASPDEQVTVTLTLQDGVLEAEVEPVDLLGLLDGDGDGDRLDLARVLRAVIDDYDYEGSTVRLTKRVDG